MSRHETVDADSWCDRLDRDLQTKTEMITYLAPLELFDSDSDEIKCGDALLRKMTPEELAGILNNNRIFNPSAYIDIAQIQDYHFLVAVEEKTLGLWDALNFGHLFRGDIAPSYSGFVQPIESALQLLALWGWGGLDPVKAEYARWKSVVIPRVPFVIERSNSPFAFLPHLPT